MIGTSVGSSERIPEDKSRDVMASGLGKDLPNAKRRKLVSELSYAQRSKIETFKNSILLPAIKTSHF